MLAVFAFTFCRGRSAWQPGLRPRRPGGVLAHLADVADVQTRDGTALPLLQIFKEVSGANGSAIAIARPSKSIAALTVASRNHAALNRRTRGRPLRGETLAAYSGMPVHCFLRSC